MPTNVTPPTRTRFTIAECRLGHVLAAVSDAGVCAILLGDDPAALRRELAAQMGPAEPADDPALTQIMAAIVAAVDAPGRNLNLPLAIGGTAFQRRVWAELRAIPPGQTASYAQIAGRIGSPGAVRAVARACAANRLAVAIPCHRVVRQDGAPSGYRWGAARKRALLAREQATA